MKIEEDGSTFLGQSSTGLHLFQTLSLVFINSLQTTTQYHKYAFTKGKCSAQ